MNVTHNKIDELNALLTVTIEKEDYQADYEKQLKDYGKKVQMPGFRTGKVPMSLVKKKFGGAVLSEKINAIINEQLNNYITSNDLPVLGNPMPADDAEDIADWENPDQFVFNFQLGLAPEFDYKLTKREKHTYHVIKADDEMVERQIDDLRRRHGKLSEPNESGEKDLLIGDFVELDENGEIKEGGILSSSNISLEFIENEKAKKPLIGLKPGDRVKVNVNEISKGDADKAKMLNIQATELEGVSENFDFIVKEVKRLTPAELNQELFDKLYAEGEVTDEATLRSKVAEEIEKGFSNDSNKLFRQKFIEKTLDKVKIELPDTFLKKWIKQANDKPITEEDLAKDYPQYADNLRWQLIENKIAKDNDIKVESEDIEGAAANMVAMQYAQYGLKVTPEELKNHVSNFLQNESERNRLIEAVVQDKVMAVVKENVKVEEKEVNYNEFIELMYGPVNK